MPDFSSALMGAHFRGPDIKELVKTYEIGKKLTTRREPGNAYDANAIMILDGEEHVGYVEGGLAQEIAPLMDASPDRALNATVSGFLTPTKPYLDLEWADAPNETSDE